MPLHPVWHRLHACGHQKLFHKTPSSAANIVYKRKRASEVIHQKRQQAVFHLRSRGEEEVVGKNKAQPSFFLQTDFEDVWELACVVGAWMYWVKERTGAREGAHIFFLCPLLPSACYAGYLGIRWGNVESFRSQYPGASNFHLHLSWLFYPDSLLLEWFWPKYWSSIATPPPPPDPTHRREKPKFTWPDTIHVTCATER